MGVKVLLCGPESELALLAAIAAMEHEPIIVVVEPEPEIPKLEEILPKVMDEMLCKLMEWEFPPEMEETTIPILWRMAPGRTAGPETPEVDAPFPKTRRGKSPENPPLVGGSTKNRLFNSTETG